MIVDATTPTAAPLQGGRCLRSASTVPFLLPLLFGAVLLPVTTWGENQTGWTRHVIDNSSIGADGVRCADVNHDGRPDIVTGWEEGGLIKAYFHPGSKDVTRPWPDVVVGRVSSVEDAVCVDADQDGVLDVVSSAEGKQRTLTIHWGPADPKQLRNAGAWQTDTIPASQNLMMWMYALPSLARGVGVGDGRFWAAGKGEGAWLGWWECPARSRSVTEWRWQPFRPVGWIMSLRESDMDADGDLDLVFTDRRGTRRGCYWLENSRAALERLATWEEHLIGGANEEVMFMNLADLDDDGREDVLVALKPRLIGWFRRRDGGGLHWERHDIPFPENSGTAKAVAAGDLDLDGQQDLVVTCEQANAPKAGVIGMRQTRGAKGGIEWAPFDISGPEGVKYDLVELIDLDGDGDLDVVTCEEQANLGVIWYENPGR